MLEIKNSVAVITAGGGGIGLALAKHRIANGGKVVIADISQERSALMSSVKMTVPDLRAPPKLV